MSKFSSSSVRIERLISVVKFLDNNSIVRFPK